MDKNITGRFIAELRKQKGFTQKELAEKLMVTDKAISRWETGKGLPDTSLLKPLGDVLGVSITELLSGKRIEEVDMKEQADNIILESLNYSKRMPKGSPEKRVRERLGSDLYKKALKEPKLSKRFWTQGSQI